MKIEVVLVVIIFALGFVSFQYLSKKHTSEVIQTEQQQANHGQHSQHSRRQGAQGDSMTNQVRTVFGSPLSPVKYSKYNNYFGAISQGGKLYRWNKTNLFYYIEPTAKRRINKSLIKKAFHHWTRKSKIFSFREVKNPRLADIQIDLATTSQKKRLGEAGPDKLVRGNTYNLGGRSYREAIIKHAKVVISEEHFSFKNVQQYKKEGKEFAFGTLVHELGHVLGLMGHSPKQGDCMYFQSDRYGKACYVMTADVNTLGMLYGVRTPLNRGFHDAQISVQY